MFCDKCGKELAPGSIFCPDCGAKQSEDSAAPETASQSVQQENPKVEAVEAEQPVKENIPPERSKAQAESVQASAPQSAPTDSDAAYRTIIAKNTEYYLPQFQSIAYGEKGKMNWASFFLSLYHAAYRGVWREWLHMVMWPLILDVVCALSACALIVSHPVAALVFVVVAACGGIWWVVANILFAKRFNRIYKAHVERKIAQQNITPDPSGKRVVCSVLAYMAVNIVTSMIFGALSVGSLMAGIDDSTYSDADSNDSSAYNDAAEDHDNTDATAPDTSGSITGTNVYDYLGYWTVDRYNSYLDGYVGFNLESNNDILCFSAQAVWNQGDRVTTIDTVSLEMNYDGTQAGGYYQDDRGNEGNIVLDFENGELYLTVTCRNGGDWAMTMEHEHCTLDPNGVQEEYADPDLPSYSESGYDYYSDGQTVSRGINDVSSDYIGSNHLWPTDTLTITNSDLSVLTRTEVAEIRNEIFARHGYVFSSSQWSDYFSTADWYYPDSSFSNDMLSSTEKQNIDTITAYEKAQGWNQ